MSDKQSEATDSVAMHNNESIDLFGLLLKNNCFLEQVCLGRLEVMILTSALCVERLRDIKLLEVGLKVRLRFLKWIL